MLGAVVRGFKGEEGDSRKMEKQMLGKQVFPGPCGDNGTQRGILTDFPSTATGSPCSALRQRPLPTPHAVSGEGQRLFLSLLGDCFQLQIICMPKRCLGVASFAPPKLFLLFVLLLLRDCLFNVSAAPFGGFLIFLKLFKLRLGIHCLKCLKGFLSSSFSVF